MSALDQAMAEVKAVLGKYPAISAHMVALQEGTPEALAHTLDTSIDGDDEAIYGLRQALLADLAGREEDAYVASGAADEEARRGIEREARLAGRLVTLITSLFPDAPGVLLGSVQRGVQEALMAEGLWSVDSDEEPAAKGGSK